MSDFKKGEKVVGTTTKGKKVSGSVEHVRSVQRGKFVDVKDADGNLHSFRPSQVVKA
jgi:hypothetical protein